MPELPEVEAVRRGLVSRILNKCIEKVDIYWSSLFVTSDDITLDKWQEVLTNTCIKSVDRRGKYLLFTFTNGYSMASHLRMEGKYFYFTKDSLPKEKDKHTHVMFYLTDGSQLHYNDVRKFGRFELFESDKVKEFANKKKLGPEPTESDFDLEAFKDVLSNSKKMIKQALLSQEFVVGLGNIYCDEVLYISNIHPETACNKLSEAEVTKLHEAIISVLEEATKLGGSSVRTYEALGSKGSYQDKLKVYGKEGTK